MNANKLLAAQSAGIGGGAGGPAWPGGRARLGDGHQRRLPPALMAAMALALVVLIVMGVMVGSALGNGFGSMFTGNGGGLGGQAATVAPTPTATMTPSPTPSPTPLPPQNWLTVQPDNITLGCQKNKKTQYVRLSNQGDEPLGWQAQLPSYFPGVKVSPSSDTLEPNHSVNIAVTNTSQYVGVQNQITFVPTNADAGDPAVLHYSTEACAFNG